MKKEDMYRAITNIKHLFAVAEHDEMDIANPGVMMEDYDLGDSWNNVNPFWCAESTFRAHINNTANGKMVYKIAFRAVMISATWTRSEGGCWQFYMPTNRECLENFKFAKQAMKKPLKIKFQRNPDNSTEGWLTV